ncbi:hypothetical protein TSMEX_005767 [Taenia solium]|eukprot:TsM_000916400 transcript=TsM_000916400 gene=TsM_000916400
MKTSVDGKQTLCTGTRVICHRTAADQTAVLPARSSFISIRRNADVCVGEEVSAAATRPKCCRYRITTSRPPV